MPLAAATKPPLTPDQLSSYIAVNADGTVSVYFGKMDMGQGLAIAIRQMVAEELDVPFKEHQDFHRRHRHQRQSRRRLRLDRRAGRRQQMRMAAAEARRVLVEMAADKLGVPADQLTVTDGVVHAANDAAKKISYGELIGGQFFNVASRLERQIRQSALRARQGQPKIRRITRSSASRSRATTSRRRSLRKPISSPTSKCRAWCTAA